MPGQRDEAVDNHALQHRDRQHQGRLDEQAGERPGDRRAVRPEELADELPDADGGQRLVGRRAGAVHVHCRASRGLAAWGRAAGLRAARAGATSTSGASSTSNWLRQSDR